jgi:hypothetical protein
VCTGTVRHLLFPGNEDQSSSGHYWDNPGELWAETYRILAGGTSKWVFDPRYAPDKRALAAARRDVLKPWTTNQYIVRRGTFSRRRGRWKFFKVPVENDGTVDLNLRSRGSLDADIYIYDPSTGHQIDRSARSGRTEHYVGTYCAQQVRVGVYRYRGYGSWTMKLTLPYSN